MPTLYMAALAAAMAAAAGLGQLYVATVVAGVQLLFALAAVPRSAAPAARVSGWPAAAAGLAGTAWTAMTGRPDLRAIAVVLPVAFVCAVVVELARRDGRPQLTQSLAMTVAACSLALLSVAWIALRAGRGGASAVALGGLGVVAVGMLEAVPMPVAFRRILGVAVAGALAATVVLFVPDVAAVVPTVDGVVVATFTGLTAVAALAAVDHARADLGRPGDTALRATLPILAAGPVAYVLGSMLVG